VTDVAGVGSCQCEPTQQVECERSYYPTCGGYCPNNGHCTPVESSAVAAAHCECQPPPPTTQTEDCVDQQYPSCTGSCPGQTQRCAAVNGMCICEEQTVECADSYQYQCTGECPTGERCVRDAYGGCNCIHTDCEDATAPACNGQCPNGENCEYVGGATAQGGCDCVPESVDCADADYPSCVGDCPTNERCTPMQTSCECTTGTWTPACETSDYPACSGTCPAGQTCTAMQRTCACVTDYTCSSMSSKMCGQGTCPPDMYCGVGTSADYCMCYSAPV
jgi:hypothetical protein